MSIKISDGARVLLNATPMQVSAQLIKIASGIAEPETVSPWPASNSGTALRMTRYEKGHIGVFGDWVMFTEFQYKYRAHNRVTKNEISTYISSGDNALTKGYIAQYIEDTGEYRGPVPDFTQRAYDRPAPRLLTPSQEIETAPLPPAPKVVEVDAEEALIAKLEKEVATKQRIAKLKALLEAPETPKPAAPAPAGGLAGYTAKDVAGALLGVLFVLIQILPCFIPNNGPAIRSELAQANADAMKYQTDRDTALFTFLKQMSDKQDLMFTKTGEMLTNTNAMLGNLISMIAKMTSTIAHDNDDGSKSVQHQEIRRERKREAHKGSSVQPWNIVAEKPQDDDETSDHQQFYVEQEAEYAREPKQAKPTNKKADTKTPEPTTLPPNPVITTWSKFIMWSICGMVIFAVVWSLIETLKV
jgi:hypothetical protein